MKKEDILELEARRRIYNYIKETPGAHLRDIKRALELPMGVLEHHLRYLEKHEIISAKKDRYYKRYYLTRTSHSQKALLSVLRQKKPRDIVLFLILNPGSRHKDVMERFGLGASTVSFYVKHLIQKGVVEKRKVGRTSEYRVMEVDEVVRVLITYRPSFLDKLVDHFFEVWFDDMEGYQGTGPIKTKGKRPPKDETTFDELPLDKEE